MRDGVTRRAAATLVGWLAAAAPVVALAETPPTLRAATRTPVRVAAAAPFAWSPGQSAPASRVPVFGPSDPNKKPADPGAIRQVALVAAADVGFGDGGISCVPFARAVSGIDVTGDAATWWDNAAGRYGRGAHPEPGGVLSFRAIDQMPLGHVAVVARILDSRRITVDHANWDNAGGVARGVAVMDVSPNNDWTQVRVALGDGGDFGAVYPTDGFIYKHPDGGAMVATADTVAAAPPPGPPRPALSAHPAAALPVVQSGPTGRGQIYLANSIFGVAGPNPGATPGAWLIAAARPRVVIASGGTRAR